LVVWQYVDEQPLTVLADGQVWAVQIRSGQPYLMRGPALIDLARQAAAMAPHQDIYHYQRGTTFSVRVQVDHREREIRQYLERHLQAMGNRVADGQELVVVARADSGEDAAAEFTPESSQRGVTQTPVRINYRPVTHRVQILRGNELLWERQSFWTVQLGRLLVPPGQTPQQVVDGQRRESYKFYETVELPERIMKSMDAVPPGKSQWSPPAADAGN
jgi:hypothetical protein